MLIVIYGFLKISVSVFFFKGIFKIFRFWWGGGGRVRERVDVRIEARRRGWRPGER